MTLDEEWLGGKNQPIEDDLLEWGIHDLRTDPAGAYSVIRHAAGEIRALRLLVKNQDKRIDELVQERDEE